MGRAIVYDPFLSCAVLKVINSEFNGLVLAVPHGAYTIGRLPSCNHFLPHPTVSRTHCVVVVETTGFMVRDAGSTHGVEVNGRVISEMLVQPCDQILVGDVLLVLEVYPLKLIPMVENIRYPDAHHQEVAAMAQTAPSALLPGSYARQTIPSGPLDPRIADVLRPGPGVTRGNTRPVHPKS